MCWAGKREKILGSASMRETDMKRAQTFRTCKALKKHNRLGSCQTKGAFPEQKDSKILPVLPQFPPSIKREEYMLSLPLKDRAKSFTDLVK